MRLLVFAIASHNQVYDKLAAIWKLYMNSRPWIKSYLIYGGSSKLEITADEIHFPVTECLIPGILHKTIWAFRLAVEGQYEYDYVLRTNLSSFWILDRVYDYLCKMPTTKTIISNREYPLCPGNIGILNGSGMFFSRDVVEYLASVKNYNYAEPDDREITQHAYYGYGANFVHKPFYFWIVDRELEVVENVKCLEESDAIQVRIRNPYHDDEYKNLALRETIDPKIHRTLFWKYYVVN